MDKLDHAIAAFEDESSDLTLGERVCMLRDALMWNAFRYLKAIGAKKKVAPDDEFRHMECMKHFKDIEKMYTTTVKMNKLMGKSDDKMNDEFLKSIRAMKGSLGSIVRDLKDGTNG